MPTEYPEIFRALAAPFPKERERTRSQGGQTLTYITARSVQNRLDEVVGPENWWPHFEETKDGIKCALTIRMPDGREVTKEDGGGFATSMKAEDDVEKSGYSDALKRAGVAWGVGRYLYRDGVPAYRGARGPTGAAPSCEPAGPLAYGRWLDEVEGEINGKWREYLEARGHAYKDLVDKSRINDHLIEAMGCGGERTKDEGANLKIGERLWGLDSEAMRAEALAYCRDQWQRRTARPAREPGSDDVPSAGAMTAR